MSYKDSVKVIDLSNKNLGNIKNANSMQLEFLASKDVSPKGEEKVTFADIGGLDEAKRTLKKKFLYPLKYHTDLLSNTSAEPGIILAGVPGTGKTQLAKALANEANLPYFQINASDLESEFTGVTERNYRETFEKAKQNEPSFLVMDEIDAVFKKRKGSVSSEHDDKIVNQYLTLMTDLKDNHHKVFVIGITNRPELLDDAVTRRGRNQLVPVPPPDLKACGTILDLYINKFIKKSYLSKDFNFEKFQNDLFKNKTTGADIESIVAESKENALERLGIYDKMDDGTFTKSDEEGFKVEPEDFDKALVSFVEEQKLKKKQEFEHKEIKGFSA